MGGSALVDYVAREVVEAGVSDKCRQHGRGQGFHAATAVPLEEACHDLSPSHQDFGRETLVLARVWERALAAITLASFVWSQVWGHSRTVDHVAPRDLFIRGNSPGQLVVLTETKLFRFDLVSGDTPRDTTRGGRPAPHQR